VDLNGYIEEIKPDSSASGQTCSGAGIIWDWNNLFSS